MRPTKFVIVIVSMLLLLSGLAAGQASGTTGISITTPSYDADRQFTASGTIAPNSSRAWIAIRHKESLEWWTPNGYQQKYERHWATVSDGTWSFEVSNLRQGAHRFLIQAFEDGRRSERTSRSILVDSAAPGATTTTGLPTTTTTTALPTTTTTSAPPTTTTTAAPRTGDRKLATIIMSRSLWGVPSVQCGRPNDTEIASGSKSLEDVASALQARDIRGTHTITPTRHFRSEPKCVNGATLTASWDFLETLRDTYGWSAASHGKRKRNMNRLTLGEQLEESCGSLPLLEARGFTETSAFFAFPGNHTNSDGVDVAATCFTFGRQYRDHANTFAQITDDSLINTRSVNGGTCPAAGCVTTNLRDYDQPTDLVAAVLGGGGNRWGLLQFYKLVEGRKTSGFNQWDCSSANAAEHWTTQGEIYCWNDFLEVVDGLDAAGVEWVVPADVRDEVEAGTIS